MLIRYTAAERRHRCRRHITPVHWLHQSRSQSQASCARYPDLRVIPLLPSANQTSSHPLSHHMTQSRATTPPLPNLRVPPGDARKSIGVSPASDQRRCGRRTREGVSPNLRKRGRGVGLLWSVIYRRSRGMVGEGREGGRSVAFIGQHNACGSGWCLGWGVVKTITTIDGLTSLHRFYSTESFHSTTAATLNTG
jgi:hypothetical protein